MQTLRYVSRFCVRFSSNDHIPIDYSRRPHHFRDRSLFGSAADFASPMLFGYTLAMRRMQNNGRRYCRFKDLEACFFCLRAIQEGIPFEESTYLPVLLDSAVFSRLPKGDSVPLSRLAGTCLILIGKPVSFHIPVTMTRRLLQTRRQSKFA